MRVEVEHHVTDVGVAADEVGEVARGQPVPGRHFRSGHAWEAGTWKEQADRCRLGPVTGGGGTGLRHGRVGHVRRRALTLGDYKSEPRIGNGRGWKAYADDARNP
ncbi:hypothetical protein GCM10027290_58900 [Micromonospora sonneratiae]